MEQQRQLQVPLVVVVKDHSGNKKISRELAESLRCPLIDEIDFTQALQKISLPSSTITQAINEPESDLAFEFVSQIVLTHLKLKLNVVINLLLYNDARLNKLVELEDSENARLIFIQSKTNNRQDDDSDRHILKVITDDESFNAKEVVTKMFDLCSHPKKGSHEKIIKEPTNDHLHELVLFQEPRLNKIQCKRCLELVSGRSYECVECNEYTFHKFCAEASPNVRDCPPWLREKKPKHYDFPRTYKCNNCEEFLYGCCDCLFQTNLELGFLPAILYDIDEAHQHFFNLIIMPFKYNYQYKCIICDEVGSSVGYKCYDCNYDAHVNCILPIVEKTQIKAYQTIFDLFKTIHVDNIEVLKHLIYAKDDQLPLYDGAAKKRSSFDVLRRKHVLLYITDLELPKDELPTLNGMYNEARQLPLATESNYEVVWFPVVDWSTPWNNAQQKQFKYLQSRMPWFSVYHPLLLDPAVIKYIKQVWCFNKKPLLVVLDPQGKVVNHNALHMMRIWGSLAFPFTSLREEALWEEESWSIELMADGIDANIPAWIQEGKYICLYGGEDIEWIRRFTTTAAAVAIEANIQLEMLYVGKINLREKVRKINTIIQIEKLSHVLSDLALMQFFWFRLESMYYSKVKNNRTVEKDSIMQEIITMLTFDATEQGWAVVSKGSGGNDQMAKAKGSLILRSFDEFRSWKHIADERGFVPALIEYLLLHQNKPHCNRLIMAFNENLPRQQLCAECGRPMEMFMMYRCCDE
ncbi:hypothetical protein JCGZ_00054 [Jatropha curcas]|uniref:Sieve element occlusion C-terminal domain-containing protein n=1 Tax=Jatropha curcas TaxID=180498 RepID=A0A067LIE8_JATCU|nr:protein SIEVE ELEMENT OCCLUSION B [Jatropha curcas]KDP47163.1 hypothetical protein JCGZ_00054 [Jatropha curcas]